MRTGAPWRDLPQEYGPWQTVYGLFPSLAAGRHAADGADQAAGPGGDAAGPITWEVSIDSTIRRAHQHAAGVRRDGKAQQEPPGGIRNESGGHGLGRRSRSSHRTSPHR
ncbi:hypothetical protein [Streptomyces sp. NPDC058011]|uniref:hypothetical protein n=1 Tax=Streptomyces sp. NPDC058011 TaxID=3346305 RepID=UPI0036F14391